MSTIATVPGPRPPAQPPSRQAGLRAVAGLASLVISFVVPLLSYDLIRPHVGSSAMALALAGRVAGDREAERIQLAIEYDPRPPYQSGSPASARPEVVALLMAGSRFARQG